MERGEIVFVHPTQDDVLFDRSSDGIAHETSRNSGKLAKLIPAQIAQWKADRDHGEAWLALAVDVCARPCLEPG